MAIKGILFDFNGTLFFDSEYHARAFELCCEKYGMPVFDRQFMINNIFGRTNAEICMSHYIPNATEAQIEEFGKYKEKLYTDACIDNPTHLHLCEGVTEMLDYLKKNSIPYCIATGSPLENVEFYFEHLGLGKWFTMDNLVYCDGSFAGKPAPDIYLLAAKRLGLDTSECAIFEDGTSGILAARAAGAGKVIAVWEQGLPSPLNDKAQVDGVYHDFSEWKKIFAELGLINRSNNHSVSLR